MLKTDTRQANWRRSNPDKYVAHRQVVDMTPEDWRHWLDLSKPEEDLLRALPEGSLKVHVVRTGSDLPPTCGRRIISQRGETMFQCETDWDVTKALICDILRGSAALAVASHLATNMDGERKRESRSWTYSQTQTHRANISGTPRLFSPEGLEDMLTSMSQAGVCFAYEVSGEEVSDTALESILEDFHNIRFSVVKLTVGDVALSWILVALTNSRDEMLWKMKYHAKKLASG